MKRQSSTFTPTLAERVQAANKAMRAYRNAKRRGAPTSHFLRLLESWREALERMYD